MQQGKLNVIPKLSLIVDTEFLLPDAAQNKQL